MFIYFTELKDVIQKYLTTGEIDAKPELLKKFTSYCTYYDVPYLQGGELVNGKFIIIFIIN